VLRREEGSGLIEREDVNSTTLEPSALLAIHGSVVAPEVIRVDPLIVVAELIAVIDVDKDGTRKPGGAAMSSSESSDRSVSSVPESKSTVETAKESFVGLEGNEPCDPALIGKAEVSRQERMSKLASNLELETRRSRSTSSSEASEDDVGSAEPVRELETRCASSLSSPLRRF
jgi:hypothetical protein